MLVLTRRLNQSIMIGDDVEVTVVSVKGTEVRLGIKAPSHTAVHREEIYLQLQQENQQAAQTGLTDVSGLSRL